MHQVTALSCRFWRKCNFACKRPKSKMKMLIVGCTRNQIYTTGHGKASPFQPWWSVRGAIRTFDVNRCSLPSSTFCFCLLRLGLAVTGSSGWKLRNADTRCAHCLWQAAAGHTQRVTTHARRSKSSDWDRNTRHNETVPPAVFVLLYRQTTLNCSLFSSNLLTTQSTVPTNWVKLFAVFL